MKNAPPVKKKRAVKKTKHTSPIIYFRDIDKKDLVLLEKLKQLSGYKWNTKNLMDAAHSYVRQLDEIAELKKTIQEQARAIADLNKTIASNAADVLELLNEEQENAKQLEATAKKKAKLIKDVTTIELKARKERSKFMNAHDLDLDDYGTDDEEEEEDDND